MKFDALNNYQRQFIEDYCWLGISGRTTSMCEGDLYIEVRRDPTGLFLNPQLAGVDFQLANENQVLQQVQWVKQFTAQAEQ